MRKLAILIVVALAGCGEAFSPDFFPPEGDGGVTDEGETEAPPEEDGADSEPDNAVDVDAGQPETDAPDPCDTCAHTEWFCAGFVCGTSNCYICQDPACAPKSCTYLGQAEINYPTWCCSPEGL